MGVTLVELMVAMAVVGVTFLALYSGLTHGYSRVRLSRENQRATQLLLEKMEVTRLYSWAQLTESGFDIPTKFTATYYPNKDPQQGAGVTYHGEFTIEDVTNIVANYAPKMKKVTVQLDWETGHLKRTRSLSTYVSEFGLHSRSY